MDGEESKSRSRRRSKLAEVNFDSDDNEPLGSLLNFKKPKNPKRVKAGLEKMEIEHEKLVGRNETVGGMDDTLASFMKKLRGPKRDSGSGVLKESALDSNVVESLDQFSSGAREDVNLEAKGAVRTSENGCREGGDGDSGMIMDMDLKTKIRRSAKRRKIDPKTKATDCLPLSDDNTKCLGSQCAFTNDKKECENHSVDENVDESLSAYFQRAQFGSFKKYCSSSEVKHRSKHSTLGVRDNPKPRHRSISWNQTQEDQKSEDNSHLGSSMLPSSSTCNESKTEGNQMSSTNESVANEILVEHTVAPSISEACYVGVQEEKVVILRGSDVQEALPYEANKVLDVDKKQLTCGQLNENCSTPSVQTFNAQPFNGGSEDVSAFMDSALAHDGVELPNSNFMGDSDISAEGNHNRDTVGASVEPSEAVAPINVSNAECKTALAEKEGDCACLGDGLADKSCARSVNRVSGKTESGSHFGDSPDYKNDAQIHSSGASFDSLKVEDSSSDCDDSIDHSKQPVSSSVLLHEENAEVVKKGSLSESKILSEAYKYRNFYVQTSLEHKTKNFVSFIQKCNLDSQSSQPSDDLTRGTSIPNQDSLSLDEDTCRSSPTALDGNESCPEDVESVPDPGIKGDKLLIVQRATRKANKRRYTDMAYEGDADWEILSDQALKTEEREAEDGGVVAVSAGLKARAVGPVEKIKFKEVLKRKGGIQEYLECRNYVLHLWNKDVSRILHLKDCGVSDTPNDDEPSRASLIREVYRFLDQSGYINFGVALGKGKAEPIAKHSYKLIKERGIEEKADSEDGVSFILGQVRSSETSTTIKNDAKVEDEIQLVVSEEMTGLIHAHTSKSLCVRDYKEIPTEENAESGVPVKLEVERNAARGSQSVLNDHRRNSYQDLCDADVKKKVIVIGAGPAGLTAARHLHRQGFSVTVLEARNRLGGRVYTDRSSLSVPVDLGASIITGVEADMTTERRPDPSSLVCAQLGLELTVLNSDCPLYDVVTGQKVPVDLDDALEAEYNSLLDEMVLVVAQKGENAMKMSLEDGLEYALKKRRMARPEANIEEPLQGKLLDTLSNCKDSVDGAGLEKSSREDVLSPIERRVINWHFAHLEYGCAALLKDVSLPYWNQDDVYGGFGGAHCMIKGGYSTVVESLGEGLSVHLNHVVTNVTYSMRESQDNEGHHKRVKVSTSNGREFLGDAVLITVPLGCLKAGTIKFSPPLPQWKDSSIQRLGFGVLNKVVLEFPKVFWDDSVDYFGATSEETNQRGQCFMFWNVRKTVGAPVLIALVVGKAAIDGQNLSSSDHVNHALMVLRKLFGESSVPDPVASVVTDWGRDPFSHGAYSYVAIGASGEDYDMLGRPVQNCLFFAGEATCKEHPDTVGGAMMSGLREAVRIIDILCTGNDYTAEVEAMEAAQRRSDCERDEVRHFKKRLEAVELSNSLYENTLEGTEIMTREALLQDMFFNARTTAGRLLLAKELLRLPVRTLKTFAGTKKGLATLNSWILDSLGKDGTQLLRHCVRILVIVSTDLLAVRLSGIGKTVKEKVCVHTSRDIRAIASQLVSVWLEIFRKEKANGRFRFSRQASVVNASRKKLLKDFTSGKPPLRAHHGVLDNKGGVQLPASSGKLVKQETTTASKLEGTSKSVDTSDKLNCKVEEGNYKISEEEKAAIEAAERAHAAARAAAEAYASLEAKRKVMQQLPKIPSFHKFVRREHCVQAAESDPRRKWSGRVLGRQDYTSEMDSRNCKVRDWSVEFSAACANLDSSRISGDNLSQPSNSNDINCHLNFREHSEESAAVDSNIFTKAWVDSAGSDGIKDFHAIERWKSQAAAAGLDFFHPDMHINDEEDSNRSFKQPTWRQDGRVNESSVSQVSINKDSSKNHPKGADHIKQAVIDFVATLLMPLYKARKIDREGYKSIMKKSATKVMEQATDAEKAMTVQEFLDFKRRNKIRAFVDKLIERHMATKPVSKP